MKTCANGHQSMFRSCPICASQVQPIRSRRARIAESLASIANARRVRLTQIEITNPNGEPVTSKAIAMARRVA